MSCSKVFSGDLPELIYEIIKYFQKDYSTLHSCILVNRLWCRLAIPLLWENPFSIPRNNFCVIDIYLNDDLKMKLSECKTIDNKFSIPEKNYHISDIYFKTKLNEYKIINNSLLSNTLFNYPKFLKYLNTYNFILSVELWLRLYSLRRIDRLNMYVPLLTIFFENEVNLHTLEIENINTSNRYSAYVNMILEVISQNTNFIQNIRNLKYCVISYHINENPFTYQVLYLIENIQQNLNYLSICTDDGTECSSIILQNLGQILPPKLEYLCLELDYIKTSDFEVFLKNSQNTFIKKLIIHYDDDEQDILPSIKKYIMKKKRVKYLAINEMVTYSKESVSLMNEVKRFELYNIKVQDSNILEISAYDYIIRN
ncbi:unnamed protein product [Rhizophagus irregularis]|nr:unnamed protein product [Rhizophagus irregularis]